jgi:hypothetical protein
MKSKLFENPELLSRIPEMLVVANSNGDIRLQSYKESIAEKLIPPRIHRILEKIKMMDEVMRNNPGVQLTRKSEKLIDQIYRMD